MRDSRVISIFCVNASWVIATVLVALFGGCFDDPHARREIRQGECATCHIEDYNRASSPIHIGGLSMDCNSCHSTMHWSPSSFVHEWPLVGVHADAQCNSCHGGVPPVYAGTSNRCVDCHLDDFESSTYPGHSMFPETCADCHTPAGWTPALEGTHPDDIFPITSGAHEGIACMDCHDIESGQSVFGDNTMCTACHTHERAVVDAQHESTAGYVYDELNLHFCLSCHPSGEN